jgi:hypothetical protein
MVKVSSITVKSYSNYGESVKYHRKKSPRFVHPWIKVLLIRFYSAKQSTEITVILSGKQNENCDVGRHRSRWRPALTLLDLNRSEQSVCPTTYAIIKSNS